MLQRERKAQIESGQAGKEEPMPSEESREELSFRQKRIIDGFDEVAKGLAAGTISRRRALKLTGTALLGGGLLAIFPRVAGAAQSSIVDETDPTVAASDPGCRGEPAINNRRCPENTCGGNPDCLCVETVHGTKKCVNVRDEECPTRDECDRSRGCRRGEVCARVGGCCGHPRRNVCVRLCS